MKRRTVLFLTSRLHSPSTRYRALAYFPFLREAGWEPAHLVVPRRPWHRLGVLRAVRRAEVTVVCRRLFGSPLPWLLRRAAPRLVFDLDDALMARPDGRPSATRLRRFRQIVRVCDQVWAGNHFLAVQCRALNGSVMLVPTAVEPAAYDPATAKPPEALDLVWIGSSSTRRYLEAALPVLARAAEAIPQARLKVIADFELPAPGLRTISIPWSEASEAAEIASAHIGISPLPDDPWTRGKCGLKVLQYMAAGLPVVASAVGAHRDIVIHGATGFLVSHPEEWAQALGRLAGDTRLATTMGMRGRARVEEQFAVRETFRTVLAALEAM